jgi:hypothetical protein
MTLDATTARRRETQTNHNLEFESRRPQKFAAGIFRRVSGFRQLPCNWRKSTDLDFRLIERTVNP